MSLALVWYRDSAPLLHGEADGLLEPMSSAERQDVRAILAAVARKLVKRNNTAEGVRRKVEAIVAHLIAALDAIDDDPDLEISADVDGAFSDDGGFEPNFATTAAEDASGVYAKPPHPWVRGLNAPPDELEEVCEDEGAQCEDEGAPDDNGLADAAGAVEQGYPSTWMTVAAV